MNSLRKKNPFTMGSLLRLKTGANTQDLVSMACYGSTWRLMMNKEFSILVNHRTLKRPNPCRQPCCQPQMLDKVCQRSSQALVRSASKPVFGPKFEKQLMMNMSDSLAKRRRFLRLLLSCVDTFLCKSNHASYPL
jgi:hypothetical protein